MTLADEARRNAANIAGLPELLRSKEQPRGILMNYENETRDFGEDDYDRSDRARRGLLGGLAGD